MCHTIATFRFISHICSLQKSFASRFRNAIHKLALNERNRTVVEQRYIVDLDRCEYKFFSIGLWYFILSNYITIGGVLVTSFLTLQKLSIISEQVNTVFFWLSWVMSVLVTIANKSMHSFNIYSRYEFVKKRVKKYRTEGWRFISRINAYEECENDDEAFLLFMQRLDKIDSQTIKSPATKSDAIPNYVFNGSFKDGASQSNSQPKEPEHEELPRVTDIKRLSQRITEPISIIIDEEKSNDLRPPASTL